MIGHYLAVMTRAVLGALGVRVLERKFGTCGSCYCSVWDSDKRVRIHDEWFHADCAKYVRRRPA